MIKIKHWLWVVAQSLGLTVLLTGILVVLVVWRLTALFSYRGVALNSLFTATAGRPLWAVMNELGSGWLAGWQATPEPQRWLVLGTDEVVDSHRSVILTDSMMLITYQPSAHRISLLSLPRDWYLPDVGTKINALYAYGMAQQPAQPTQLLTSTLTRWMGVPINHTVIVSLDDVQALIDTLGGVEVTVPVAFTDPLFPRTGVDITKEHDPQKLYETVSFASGSQQLSGEMALKYMRSRHSANIEEGTDAARQRRQQDVIKATFRKMLQPEIIASAGMWGELYRWYAERLSLQVSLGDIGWTAGQILQAKKAPSWQMLAMPLVNTATSTNSGTLLVHPPTAKYGQWVYELADPTGQLLREFVKNL